MSPFRYPSNHNSLATASRRLVNSERKVQEVAQPVTVSTSITGSFCQSNGRKRAVKGDFNLPAPRGSRINGVSLGDLKFIAYPGRRKSCRHIDIPASPNVCDTFIQPGMKSSQVVEACYHLGKHSRTFALLQRRVC